MIVHRILQGSTQCLHHVLTAALRDLDVRSIISTTLFGHRFSRFVVFPKKKAKRLSRVYSPTPPGTRLKLAATTFDPLAADVSTNTSPCAYLHLSPSLKHSRHDFCSLILKTKIAAGTYRHGHESNRILTSKSPTTSVKMTDSSNISTLPIQPPPAPPLPPGRGVFQKIIAPLSFNIGARPHITHTNTSAGVSPSTTTSRIHRSGI